jgi:hypothetical protein
MKTPLCRLLLLSLLAALLCGCEITQDVTPVEPGVEIDKIYIVNNPRVLMEGFSDALAQEARDEGYEAEVVDSPDLVPQGAYSLEYTANWSWDSAWTMSMYLAYFQADLSRDGHTLGTVCYNATHGSQRLDKAGHTMDKVRPLLQELLANVRPPRR